MQKFLGFKIIEGYPEERDGKPGYAVIYSDGYRSWSPMKQFIEAYTPTNRMHFHHALAAVYAGHKVTCQLWEEATDPVSIQYMYLNTTYSSTKQTPAPMLTVVSKRGVESEFTPHVSMMYLPMWRLCEE